MYEFGRWFFLNFPNKEWKVVQKENHYLQIFFSLSWSLIVVLANYDL